MQIIDELEMSRRGPYGGGIGHVSFTGGMDMALALRTMVIPNPAPSGEPAAPKGLAKSRSEWTVHLQASHISPTCSRSGVEQAHAVAVAHTGTLAVCSYCAHNRGT